MPAHVTGHVSLRSASGRRPWDGLRAKGRAVFAGPEADPTHALACLDRLSRRFPYAGFFSYDLGRHFEELPIRADADVPLPLLAFVPTFVGRAADAAPRSDNPPPGRFLGSTFTRPDYETTVRRCLDYIAAGDVFQINFSQRLKVRTDVSPEALFDRLQKSFPAEYGGLLTFSGALKAIDGPALPAFALVSNSPELFLRVTRLPDGRRKIVNRPIKGTRPNTHGMHAALQASEKDKAELAMIVDLQRNDLGRICETGSVVVAEPRTIETHPTVLHGVATIEGVLRDGVTLADILRATFPCGSVTGCPKIRAMEVIEELEPVRRGAYCGAIGWVGGGEMELAVAIRTITMTNGVAYVPVGGGIVADSDPAAEYDETMTKAAAMLAALEVKPEIRNQKSESNPKPE